MVAINPSHQRELEELISQQIQAFKHVAPMDGRDIFEYHLRYFRIMALYREMDRIARNDTASAGMATRTKRAARWVSRSDGYPRTQGRYIAWPETVPPESGRTSHSLPVPTPK